MDDGTASLRKQIDQCLSMHKSKPVFLPSFVPLFFYTRTRPSPSSVNPVPGLASGLPLLAPSASDVSLSQYLPLSLRRIAGGGPPEPGGLGDTPVDADVVSLTGWFLNQRSAWESEGARRGVNDGRLPDGGIVVLRVLYPSSTYRGPSYLTEPIGVPYRSSVSS